MADLTYHVVDVFTDRAFAGNPLAVVLDADDLSTEQLQALAREFNLSETAFPVRDDEADYRLRIFTPFAELPFAGHPSVGTAALLAALGRVAPGRLVMRCGAGLLPVTAAPDRAEITGGTPSVGAAFDAASVLAACSLTAEEAADGTARVCSTGLPFVFVELASDGAVTRALPKPDAIAAACDVTAVVVFAWDAASRTSHARVLGADIVEDPATGSAAAAFGAWLAALGRVPADGETPYVVRQGEEMGRPSRIEGTVVTRGGAAVECRVAGGVVPVATGTIRVP
jgi:trans-2,3-dihydro-3-hydroxyanthranilate isomerase